MNPPTMMLAPAGIIATASSTETALMIETPVDKAINERAEVDGDVDEGRRHTFDLYQGFPLFRAGNGNADAFERLSPW